jgi:hypothetical protein
VSAERAAEAAEAAAARAQRELNEQVAEVKRLASEHHQIVAELERRALTSEAECSAVIEQAEEAEAARVSTVHELSERVLSLHAELHAAQDVTNVELPRAHGQWPNTLKASNLVRSVVECAGRDVSATHTVYTVYTVYGTDYTGLWSNSIKHCCRAVLRVGMSAAQLPWRNTNCARKPPWKRQQRPEPRPPSSL